MYSFISLIKMHIYVLNQKSKGQTVKFDKLQFTNGGIAFSCSWQCNL